MTHPADFLHSDFPAAQSCGLDITGPDRFLNRELSWLAFNWRVLEEVDNLNVPLLERLRFLSISATNLDEFYSVRVAGLRELARAGSITPGIDGRSIPEQLELIDSEARDLMSQQQSVLANLRKEMAEQDIHILTAAEAKEDHAYLLQYFLSHVFPVISPLAIDPAHPFPFIPNAGFALALQLERKTDKRSLRALVPIPQQISRFVVLSRKGYRYLPLEELILMHLEQLFPGYALKGHCSFSVLRDSDLEVEDEAEDLVREFEVALKRRRRGEVIRLKISANAPKALRDDIMVEFSVTNTEVIEVDGILGLPDLKELVIEDRPNLLWPNFTPRVPERVTDHDGDMFAAIRNKDMLLQHPYETFDMVVRLLQQAARDPNVLAIKQTLYRTSKRSPIVEALCEAAEDGKSVTALVELKARFDEAANIRQSRRLERAGAHVVYGFMNLKTHAKITTIVRQEGNRLVTYTHYGTGNYHPITARIYTDVSLFTCDTALGRDATKVFNYLSGYAQPKTLENISISPLTLKTTLLQGIAAEAEHAKAGKPAAIWVKLNSLIDAEVIDALYAAGQAGVKISLVIRGICGLRPGVAGLSENIRVKSVIGRFLEHSRIVCFANGHDLNSPKARVYISSADWMDRNLHRRVETLVEIHNETVKAQIVSQIMAANLADVAQSWVMQPNGSYERATWPDGSFAFSCHRFFMENPSLSGRGSAGAQDVPQLTHTDDPQPLFEVSVESPRLSERQLRKPAGAQMDNLVKPSEKWAPFERPLFDNPKARDLSRVGVVDIGSNSVRLVVFDGAARSPAYFFNEKVMCALGAGLAESGKLNPDGRLRALSALRRFCTIAKGIGLPSLTAVATAAVREASDGSDFIAQVESETGLKIHVIDGEEEARLAAQGVLLGWPGSYGLVCDIGGGSMELAEIANGQVGHRVTSPLGPLKLINVPGGKKGRKAVIAETLDHLRDQMGPQSNRLFLVGGSWRALARIDMHRRGYPLHVMHEYQMTARDVKATLRYIADCDLETLRQTIRVTLSRMALVPIAAEILKGLLKRFKPHDIAVSSYGIREGLLYEQMPQAMRDRDPLIESCHFAERKDARLPGFGMRLHKFISPLFSKMSPSRARLVRAACLLHDVSWRAHPNFRAEVCFEYATRANLGGLSHEERIFLGLALLHRYRNSRAGTRFEELLTLLDEANQKQAEILGKAMRLGAMLWADPDDETAQLHWSAKTKTLSLTLTAEASPLFGEVAEARLSSLAASLDAKLRTDMRLT